MGPHSDAAELLRAVRAAADGRAYVGAPLSDDSVEVWMRRARRAVEAHRANVMRKLHLRNRAALIR